MHAIELLKKRRSIRKYKNKLVPWDNIVSMINCAINAPIAGNVFNTKFIVVRNHGNRVGIARACHNQMWMANAPVHIAVVGEPEHQQRYYGTRGEKLYTIQNCANCAFSLIIAAEALGLGTCWVSSFDEDDMIKALGLPEQVNCHAIITVGFADEKPKPPMKTYFRTATYGEKWWSGGGRFPGYGYYSQNVMKSWDNTKDAFDKITKKILGKKEPDEEENTQREHIANARENEKPDEEETKRQEIAGGNPNAGMQTTESFVYEEPEEEKVPDKTKIAGKQSPETFKKDDSVELEKYGEPYNEETEEKKDKKEDRVA